jgi:hypothetical protein
LRTKLDHAAPSAHPQAPRAGEWIAGHLAPVAAELAGTIRDYDLADVHEILHDVRDVDRVDLILVLAAMVDPDKTPGELLAWTGAPVPSRDDGVDWTKIPASKQRGACHLCGKVMRRDKLPRHRRTQHPDAAEAAA